MANFTDTYDESRNLVEVEFQNGRDVKANEINEAQRIERVRRRRAVQALKQGVNSFNGDGFKVVENSPNTNQIKITAGTGFIGGEIVTLENDLVITSLTTPGAPRVDHVYIEVREVEKTDADFPDIGDATIGQTTTRLQLLVAINVVEGGATPSSTGELHVGGIQRIQLATLNRDANNTVTTGEIVDDRPLTGLSVPEGGTGRAALSLGNVFLGAGGGSPTTDTPIDTALNTYYPNYLPTGMVIDWYRPTGAFAIPTGWQFCDGSPIVTGPMSGQNTPDLRNKFVRGTNDTAAGLTSGGTDSNSLSHSHTVNAHHHAFMHIIVSDTQSSVGGDWASTSSGVTIQRRHVNTGAVRDPFVTTANNFSNNDGAFLNGPSQFGYNSATTHTADTSPGTSSSLSTIDNKPAYVGLIKLMKIT